MTQATIEIFGGFICLMLTVIITMTGYKRSSWKLLRWMFFTISIIFLSEACGYIFTGNAGRTAAVMNQISNFGVFFLNLVLVDLSMHYIYQLLQEKGVVPDRIFINIVRVCIAISGLILVTNFYTKWMYYFDDTNQYHRNTGWYIYAAINLICILVCSIMCIRYRKAIKKTTFVSLLVYTFTPLLAIILQAFLYGISITNLGIFITLILMLLAYLKEWSRIREGEEKKRKLLDIVVLFTIMAISMSASVVSCIVSINSISDKNSQSNSLLIAHMVNDSIENKFLKPVIVSETMSNDYSLKQYMKKSGESSPEAVEKVVASYLDSIRTGFGYQMVYAVCDASKAYYSYNGISKFVDPENDEHDIWYRTFLEEGKHYDLEVDTDEANHWELSVFVNTEITDENGNFLGVCGIGVEMKNLQRFLKQYEEKYNVKIDLIDKTGLIQVDSEAARIERDYLDSSYLQNVNADEFYYEEGTESSRMTKYMEDLDWYLVVEDCNPDKINVFELVTTSIVIFIIGLMMMGIVFAVIFIRERKASREIAEKRRISITDDMTGLFNRRAYEENCAKILEKGIVSEITLIMMDVDSLKSVNDTYGHMAGDELIIGAAKCILTSMGEYGKVYRTGGDEFVALLKCTAEQLDDMLHTFEHLTEKWEGKCSCRLSISKGVVVCKDHGDLTFDEMKELADRMMYEDKDEYYKHTGRERRKT